MTKKEYTKLSQAQQFQVMKLIEANGAKEGAFFVYAPGWDDARIASEAAVPVASVQTRRRNVFGDLRHGQGAVSVQLDELSAAMRSMRVSSYHLTKRVESLEKALNVFITAGGSKDIPRDELEELRRHFSGVVIPTPQDAT